MYSPLFVLYYVTINVKTKSFDKTSKNSSFVIIRSFSFHFRFSFFDRTFITKLFSYSNEFAVINQRKS